MIEQPDGTLVPCTGTNAPSSALSSSLDDRTRAALDASVMDGLYGMFDTQDPLSQLTQVADAGTGARDGLQNLTRPLPNERPDPPEVPVYQKFEYWPVPGYRGLNKADKKGEGDGAYGAYRRGGRPHEGIDIQAPTGTPVVAVSDGTIVAMAPFNYSTSYGNQIVIGHFGELYTQYAHLNTVTVEIGATVSGGQQLGTVGQTGNSPKNGDPHLHFEVRRGSKLPTAPVIDPYDVLPSGP